jgi:molybdenum cofactor cytidylyltransferase
VIAALILAAGQSLRMGSPKLLLRVGGHTLLRHVIGNARRSRCDDVLVVVGDAADRVGREAREAGARTVLNPRYREGMGTSLACGIAALPPDCEAVVILLGDQPRVAAEIVNALIDAYQATGKPIVASRYGAVRGVPALIARELFSDAGSLSGDQGGRSLVERHPDLVVEVALPEGAAWDVDTREDFARLARAMEPDPPPTGASPG